MALQPGEMVGAYRIVEQLGQGGMATVYKAYHAQLERHVAIKFLHHTFLEDVNFLSRFEREARIIARLDHPNIVPVYDFNYYREQPYLVMKFIDGVLLKDIIANNEVDVPYVVGILEAVAGALTYAHSQGVLHRDVKPSNIIVDREQRAYLTDFGLARIVQSGQSTLSQDMLMGTPHYMSPEQARGSEEIGPASDIYSLGVILYEVSVGRVPFAGSTPYAIVHDHIYTPLPLPSDVNPNISPRVEDVLLRALSKEPGERPSTAVLLVEMYRQAFLADESAVELAEVPQAQSLADAYSSSSKAALSFGQIVEAGHSLTPVGVSGNAPFVVSAPKTTWRYWFRIMGLSVVVLFVGGVVSLFVESRGQDNVVPTLAMVDGETFSTPLSDAAVSLIDVPNLSQEESQRQIVDSPNDEALYLALARAAWQAGETQVAQDALERGLGVATDVVAYMLTAAQIADGVDRIPAAVFLYGQSLALAEGDSRYSAVRATAGEYIYGVVIESGQLSLSEMESVLEQQLWVRGKRSVLMDIMLVRLRVTMGNLRLAGLLMRRLSGAAQELAEARLVRGELLAAEGDDSQAVVLWEEVLQDVEAPFWVVQRVRMLLDAED
jgi:serine/threonine protein kinase